MNVKQLHQSKVHSVENYPPENWNLVVREHIADCGWMDLQPYLNSRSDRYKLASDSTHPITMVVLTRYAIVLPYDQTEFALNMDQETLLKQD